ncbi:hypothetical protein AWB68_08801 [Caballeronia choica]|uniref:Uncharacterized protein n=1 Tax=Caballeronia choica TaxID=326476 RepID=A0A158L550_9BURK|nr:hypothetical protein AWB68_08801 [Caballeronia choica]
MQRNEIERRRVRRSVIGCVGHQMKVGKLTKAQLVYDLAGFGVAIVVPIVRLTSAQHVQGAKRKGRINQRGLQRGDQTIAAEQRNEPWQSGSRHQVHDVGVRRGTSDRQAQRREVIGGLAKHAPQRFVRALELEHGALPLCKPLAVFRHIAFQTTTGDWCHKTFAPVGEFVSNTAMPAGGGLHCNVERNTAVCVGGRRIAVTGCHLHRPQEIPVAICGGQTLL